MEAVNKLMVNSNSCTASFTQRAGIAAITGPQDCVDRMVAEFRRRRDAFCAGLNEVPGFRCARAGRRVLRLRQHTGTGMDSKELADYLLYEGGVSCLDGGCFGEYGEGYIRFSYANSHGEPDGGHRAHQEGLAQVGKRAGGQPVALAAYFRQALTHAPPLPGGIAGQMLHLARYGSTIVGWNRGEF